LYISTDLAFLGKASGGFPFSLRFLTDRFQHHP
jgi:hypothetical protein